ncbi:MAG: RNA polymerase sigma factor [Deltaproteobacteria bacterium]|nr:RNA polymerase sigma factor [Deltaproteobacteria bacterium]MDZ4346658.1 RNA polymerase sigma factor [Candidatus Binatia bacterium]
MDDADGIVTHIPPLRRYARALTGDHTAAEDLVQDTLERAWKRFRLWRRGTNLRAWLFAIMHNVFVNQVKASQGKQNRAIDSAEVNLPVTPPQDERLDLRDLNRALRTLSAEQREVILLIGLEQMSYDEAALVLGVPVGTVMSRLSRGREQLRLLMNRASTTTQLKVVK